MSEEDRYVENMLIDKVVVPSQAEERPRAAE